MVGNGFLFLMPAGIVGDQAGGLGFSGTGGQRILELELYTLALPPSPLPRSGGNRWTSSLS